MWFHIYGFPATLQEKNYKQFIQERTQRGYTLTNDNGFQFFHLNLNRGSSEFLNLSTLLKECINGNMCLKDSAPYYFHLLFPYGFHLVKLEGDERTNEERLQALGTIGQKFLG